MQPTYPPTIASASGPLTPEALLHAHGPFLHRLAFALLKDVSSADDAVQETLQRALAARPRGPIDRPRAWLAQILRHHVSGERRRASWRAEFEDGEGHSVQDATVDPADIALRLEREQILGQELQALHPDLRDALFLRYFEKLPMKGVASSLGITRGAAESRVHRGKAALRERLGRRFADANQDPEDAHWIAALLPIVAPGEGTAGSSAATGAGAEVLAGGEARAFAGWAAAATLCVAAVGYAALSGPGPSTKPASLVLLDAESTVEAPLSVATDTPRIPATAAVTPQKTKVAEEAAESSYAFTSHLADGTPLLGLPAVAARPLPDGGLGRSAWSATNEAGEGSIAQLTPGNYAVSTGHLEVSEDQAVELKENEPYSVSSTRGGIALPIIVSADFAQAAAAPVRLWTMEQHNGIQVAIPCTEFESSARLSANVTPHAYLFTTIAGRLASDPVTVTAELPANASGMRELDLSPVEGGGPVMGRVLDQSGRPVAGATVVVDETALRPALYLDRPRPRLPVNTESDGTFLSDFHVASGRVKVEVHADGYGLWRGELETSLSGESWDIELAPERVLRGRVVDADGEPVFKARITASLQGETYPTSWGGHLGAIHVRPHVYSDASGSFVVRGLGRENVLLHTEWFGGGSQGSLWTTTQVDEDWDSHKDDSASPRLEIRLATAPTAAGRVLDPDGRPLAGVRVNARASGNRFAGWVMTNEDGEFELRPHATSARVRPGDPMELHFVQLTQPENQRRPVPFHLGTLERVVSGDENVLATVASPAEANCTLSGRIVVEERLEDRYGLGELTLGIQSTSVFHGVERTEFDRATGRFTLSPVPPATYSLQIRHAGVDSLLTVSEIELAANQALDLGDLVIRDEGPAIAVEVIDKASGDVLGPVELGAKAVELWGTDRTVGVHLRNDGLAWKQLTALEPGQWQARLRSSQYRAESVSVTIPPEGGEIRVRLLAQARE